MYKTNDINIGVIGLGKIGLSLMRAWKDAGYSVIGSHHNKTYVDELSSKGLDVLISNPELVTRADIIVLAVRPDQIYGLINEIKSSLKDGDRIISLAAGMLASEIKQTADIPLVDIVHVTPSSLLTLGNEYTKFSTHIIVRESESEAAERSLDLVRNLFDTVGSSILIKSGNFCDYAVVAASMPAFMCAIFDSIENEVGKFIPSHVDARNIWKQHLKAFSKMIEKDVDFESVISKIATKNGVTAQGLSVIDGRFPELIKEVLEKSVEKCNANSR